MGLRLQNNPKNIFIGIIQKDEIFDLSICNPPFHTSFEDAQTGSIRKLNNLKQKNISKPVLNFGGQNSELWCEGGEIQFVGDMIKQSRQFSESCMWFSTSISKQSNLKIIYESLYKAKVSEVKTISMGQGNKISRIVAWTFLNYSQKKEWVNKRWNQL